MSSDDINVQCLPGGHWHQNCYLIHCGTEVVVVDPGGNADFILKTIQDQSLNVHAILNTHGHFDHIGAVVAIQESTGAPFLMSGRDAPIMKQSNLLRFIFQSKESIRIPAVYQDLDMGSDVLEFPGFKVNLIATPGHTPGGYCFRINNRIFTGDTLLANMPGTSELPGGNKVDLANSIKKLSQLPENLRMYPGHGRERALGEVLLNFPSNSLDHD